MFTLPLSRFDVAVRRTPSRSRIYSDNREHRANIKLPAGLGIGEDSAQDVASHLRRQPKDAAGTLAIQQLTIGDDGKVKYTTERGEMNVATSGKKLCHELADFIEGTGAYAPVSTDKPKKGKKGQPAVNADAAAPESVPVPVDVPVLAK